jgi:predicted enzyme related to lactoylglutathione lyase
MNGPVYFEIQAENIARAMKFYQMVFGWEFTRADGLPTEYWRIKTEGIRGGLLQRPAPVPPQSGTNAFACSIEVEKFDAVAEKILAAGGKVALPKFAIPGTCWQGYFLDTEGNVFGLFQVDAMAK